MDSIRRNSLLGPVIVLAVKGMSERDQEIVVLDSHLGKCQFIAKNSRSSSRFGETLFPGALIQLNLAKLKGHFGSAIGAELLFRPSFEKYPELLELMDLLKKLNQEILLGGGQEIFFLLKEKISENKITSDQFWKRFHQLLGNMELGV